MSDRSSNCLGRREESGHEQDFEGFVELSCGRHLTFKLFKDTIRKICSTNGIIQLSKPRTDIFFSLRFLLLEDGWNVRGKPEASSTKPEEESCDVAKCFLFQNYYCFFFLSFFSWRNQFPSFKAPCQSNGLLFCNDKKIICSWNDFHSDQKRPTRSLNYICKLIKINILWKSLLDTVHCAFQTFQIVKINQPFIF